MKEVRKEDCAIGRGYSTINAAVKDIYMHLSRKVDRSCVAPKVHAITKLRKEECELAHLMKCKIST